MGSPLVDSLTRAVEASPSDVPLRLHLAELLIAEGDPDAAVGHCAVALQHDPASGPARALMARAMGVGPLPGSRPPSAVEPTGPRTEPSAADGPPPLVVPPERPAFDWRMAESDVTDVAPEPTFLAPMRNPELRRLYGKSLRRAHPTRGSSPEGLAVAEQALRRTLELDPDSSSALNPR